MGALSLTLGAASFLDPARRLKGAKRASPVYTPSHRGQNANGLPTTAEDKAESMKKVVFQT